MRDVNRNCATVRAAILTNAIKSPEAAPPELGEACRSQGRIASLHLPDYDVYTVSLNTLKAAAELEIGGWERLEELRSRYLAIWKHQFNNNYKTRSSTRASVQERLKKEQQNLSKSHFARLRVLLAYRDLQRIAESASNRDEQCRNELKAHLICWANDIAFSVMSNAAEEVDKDAEQ